MTLCESCHQRVHSQNLEVAFADEIVEIKDAGMKKVYDIEMASDNHNFIANGVVVHNCNYSKNKFGNEITVIEPCFFRSIPENVRMDLQKMLPGELVMNEACRSDICTQYSIWLNSCRQAEKAYFNLLLLGATPQEARTVLPNSLKTTIDVTANMREWRSIFKLRAAGEHGTPHPQMLEVMVPLLNECKLKLPALFDDIQPMEES